MRFHTIYIAALANAALISSVLAQPGGEPTPDPERREPDVGRVQAHIQAAKSLAGTQWAEAAHYFCTAGARTNRVTDPPIEPVRLFTNVSVVGDDATVVYIIETSDGLVLIDAFYAEKLESVLLPGMRKLGLDPAQVKLVLVAHGHPDHYGGAAYFQEQYGARVGLSAADWDLLERPATTPIAKPHRDLVLQDGMAVMQGGLAVTPVSTPGHTPGSMGFIFPVLDGATLHTAALFGSSVLTTRRLTVQQLRAHLAGIEHFAEQTRAMGVDVELQNHPLFDGMWDKVAALKHRSPDRPHPFVVGSAAYGTFMSVMNECMRAALAERGAR